MSEVNWKCVRRKETFNIEAQKICSKTLAEKMFLIFPDYKNNMSATKTSTGAPPISCRRYLRTLKTSMCPPATNWWPGPFSCKMKQVQKETRRQMNKPLLYLANSSRGLGKMFLPHEFILNVFTHSASYCWLIYIYTIYMTNHSSRSLRSD